MNTVQPKTAIVFGGRSPIALSCAKYLSMEQQVFLVTRCVDSAMENLVSQMPSVSLVSADLEFPSEVGRIINEIFARGYQLSCMAFLQRYRPKTESIFSSHLAVELWSIKEALETVKSLKSAESAIQVLVSSSPAAHKVLDDQDLSYHIVKAGQEALVRYYAVLLAERNISINAIRIGSVVLKERAMSYWNSIPHTVGKLKDLTPTRRLLTSDEVGLIFAKMLLSQIPGITGQVFSADNGFELMDSIQIVKRRLDVENQ